MKEQSKKIISKIISTLITLVLILSVFLCFTVIKQIREQGYVSILGHSFFKVITGSMSPEIEIGELIHTQAQDIDVRNQRSTF